MENENTYTQLNYLNEFSFANSAVMAGITHTGEMIALRPCVENLGLNWSGQLQAIKRNEELNQLCASVKAAGLDGKKYDMICLSPAVFQDWLWSLNPKSDNFNTILWEQYKKGLVVYLLMMLKISLDEVNRLRSKVSEFEILQVQMKSYFIMNDEGLDLNKQSKEKFKEAKKLKEDIIKRLGIDPDQLSLGL